MEAETGQLAAFFSWAPHWTFGVGLAGTFYGLMVFAGSHLRPERRESLANWLMGSKEQTWAEAFCNLFDTLFDRRHFSVQRFVRSAIASVLAVMVLYVLFAQVIGVWHTRTMGTMNLWQALTMLVMVNIVADYISLIETRWLLDRFRGMHALWKQALLLVLDLIFTALIVLGLIIAYSHFLLDEIPRAIDLLALFSVYSIFFYSTFLTSIWAWLYCASAWFVRLFTQMGLNRILDVEAKPVKQIALVGACLIVLGSLLFRPLAWSEKGSGGTAIDRFLCQIDLPSCFLSARANLYSGDVAATRLFLESACRDEQEDSACYDRLEELLGDDRAMINEVWSAACAGGFARACGFYGWRYQYGVAMVEPDYQRAAELYEQACIGGSSAGCLHLGFMFSEGIGNEADPKHAAVLFEQACDGGHVLGCMALGLVYKEGRGVEAVPKRAQELLGEVCDSGYAPGCYELGGMYEEGIGVEANAERAVELFGQACEGGNARGCNSLGILFIEGRGVEANAERAAELFGQACEGGRSVGCFHLGVMYEGGIGVEANAERAFEFFGQACDGDHATGCLKIGDMYEEGIGVEENAERAAEFYGQACEGGIALGCTFLGFMYSRGRGVEENYERAEEFYRQACDGGDEAGCTFLERMED